MTVRWEEGYAPVSELLKTLATKITNNGADTSWTLHYPATLDVVDKVVTFKHELKKDATVLETVFIEFNIPTEVSYNNPGSSDGAVLDKKKNNYHMMQCVYGTKYTSPTEAGKLGTWEEDNNSVPMRYSWFLANTTTNIKSWLPVQFWISITETRVALILEGDPSANYNDRLLSFAYFGAIKPFKEGKEDVKGNFGVCVSSDVSAMDYLTTEELNRYSDNTATGINDICMLKTYTGYPMQAHYASVTTPDEFVNKKLEGPSNWTSKYHMSPVYVFHGFDGFRGELAGVVACDRSTIVNLDELTHKYSTVNADTPNTEDIYKAFMVSAPYSILNNSDNVLYALAILKSSKSI